MARIDAADGGTAPALPTRPPPKDVTRKGDGDKASAMGVELPEGVSCIWLKPPTCEFTDWGRNDAAVGGGAPALPRRPPPKCCTREKEADNISGMGVELPDTVSGV